MKRHITHLLFLLLASLQIQAQVSVKVKAPEAVVNGEQFRVAFIINTHDIDDFQFPSSEAFNIDYGPARSSSSSYQNINGKVTHTSTVTFTYTLTATKEGNHKLPGAILTSNGKKYTTESVAIEVLKADEESSSSNSNESANNTRMRTQDYGTQITGKDLFISVTASKKRVYEQEAVVLTYKLYSLVNISQLSGGMPDLAGFLTQEVQLPQEKSFKLEHHNGRNYGTVVWRQYVLFPQRTGKLTIPSIKFEGVVLQQNRTIDPFEAFFNGGSTIVEVKKTIVAPEVTIQVDELPATTQSFSGGVGEFSISSTISNNELQANDALTYKVNIKGKGNMKLFKEPVVDFPKDFEVYDPKVTDNTKVSASGASGSKTYEYVVIPRHGGNYTIPPVTFTYFNPSTKKYETVKTDSFHINVQKKEGESRSVSGHFNQEDIKILASDIRHIHLGKSRITDPSKAFHRSMSYYLISWFSVLTMLFVYFLRRYLSATNSNTVKSKKKKASKTASKRLKKASALLRDNRPYEFYEEVSKALFGYLSDKLNLQLSELNKENILELLQRKNVSETCTSKIIAVLDQCEFARFAPGDPVETMDDIYNKATEAINLLETEMKR